MGAMGPMGQHLSNDSYRDGCEGCYMEGQHILVCTHCPSPGAVPSESKVDIRKCKRGISNILGELQCDPEPNAPDVPSGGYQGSCLGCSLQSSGKVWKHAYTLARVCARMHRRTNTHEVLCCTLPHF